MNVERKVLAFQQAAIDPATGEGRGYGAWFNNQDDGGDVIRPGFFAPVLPDFLKSGFFSWGHDWLTPVAMPTQAVEDGNGLNVGWRYHSTQAAQDARTVTNERLANGQTMGLSIGYEVAEEHGMPVGRELIKAKRLFEVGFVMVPMNQLAGVMEGKSADSKRALRPHQTPTSEDPWDAAVAERNLSNDNEKTYRQAYAWADMTADDPNGDGWPDAKSAYKFIHHMVSEASVVGAANVTACSTGIAVLNGARGGTTIPDSDRKGVWDHLAQHLTDANRKPPELRGKGLGPALAYADHLDLVLIEAKALAERTDQRLAIREKEGRVLSEANRQLIAEVAKLLNDLLNRTTPEPKSVGWVLSARARLAQAQAMYDLS